jgi:hypothetical protein
MEMKLMYSDDYDQMELDAAIELCRKNPDLPNYMIDEWEKKPGSLLYVFLKEKRFTRDKGGLLLLKENQKICGFSAFYQSPFHPDIYILGVRTLVSVEFRHNLLLSTYFIPKQLELIKGRAKLALFTFDTNKPNNIYNIFQKGRLNLFLKNKLSSFPHWENLKSVNYPVYIQNTLQNVLYLKLDQNFDYDWNLLREIPYDS